MTSDRVWAGCYRCALGVLVCAALQAREAPAETAVSAHPHVAPPRPHPASQRYRRLAPARQGVQAGGAPAGLSRLRLGEFDAKPLLDEDRLREGLPGVPLRAGVNRALPGGPVSLAGAGQRSVAADGTRLWLFHLEVPGALAVRVHFSRFDLPASGRLLLYGDGGGEPDVYVRRGPNDRGSFWAASVPGEVVHLEYQGPGDVLAVPVIECDQVSHIYRGPASADSRGGLRDRLAAGSGSYSLLSLLPCQQDVNCSPPVVDPTARDAVALLEFVDGGGTAFCSGALLADNDPNTFAGYLLTAQHCLSTQAAVDSLTTYWFYQTTQCGGPFPPKDTVPKSLGGTLLATGADSDFTLIRLADDPHDGQGFAGWTDVSPTGTVVGIHHPGGSYKRVSSGTLTTDPPICGDRPLEDYWYLDWNIGVTELGSSGSPLFNANWQVVGQLFGYCGQQPGCDNPQDYNIIYGKFGVTLPFISSYLNQVAPDDSHEDNDSLAQAAPLTRGSHDLRLVDFDDYFTVVSPRLGLMMVTATYNPANVILELRLLQAGGELIAASHTGTGTETVAYNTPAGRYVIHLFKEHKWGGDYMLNVSLPPAYSDFDLDGDVDLADFGHLQACFSGSSPQNDAGCWNACLDGDNRVGADDLSLFGSCLSGPHIPASAGCTP